ncbi:putative histone-lysine N-methyltransferase-like protein [Leptotrombidium deliense]|uniref:[histone H3]-lysine(36) N-trimethyltransferase n=1 Tax=Leptotrombidium deliense TaxID=299467 RepID=A0A443SS41_9ACAR|nr:putative histone-lysine N-methyltransferase-like protein [Leptotrombidium deliense]
MKNPTSDSDESPKPEKVKSRWRRSSELESGHSSENSSFINVTGNRALESLNGSISMNAQNISSSNVSKNMEPVPEFVQIDESVYLFERRKSKSKKEVRRMKIFKETIRKSGSVQNGQEGLGSKDSSAITTKHLFRGTFIMEYVGEVLAPNEFKNRVAKYSKENRVHHYFMALKNDEIIDATYKGNLTRFVNHSCEPNIETQKRYVEAGEEVTFDYQFQRYGEKAQKCHCESINCRGYIGASNVPHIDIDGTRLTTKAKERFDEHIKNDEEFEDLALEEEIEKLTLSGGLRNRQQTLMLARLMVRAEDSVNRQKLLQVMKSTQEIAYLRLLLDYHGLQLLWSWMFELEDIWLKAEILEVLEILPIPNKTMLKDSKILDVVEKWSKHTYNCVEQHLHANATAQLTTTKNLLEQTTDISTFIKPLDDFDVCCNVIVTAENTEATSEKTESLIKSVSSTVDDNVCKETNEKGEENEAVLGNGALCTQNESGPNARDAESKHQTSDAKNENWTSNTSSKTVVKSSPISEEVKGEQPKPVPNITLLTTKLLNSWKDLKEVFRIPRLERQKRHEDEKEADRRTKELEERRARGLPIVYEKNKRGIDDRDCTIAGILGLRKKVTKRPVDDKKLPQQSNANSSPYSTIVSNELGAPTPPKVNKDAHRMQFEMELMRKQYEEAMKEYQKQMIQYSAMVQQQIIQPQPPPQPPMHYQSNFELPHPSPSQTPALLQVSTPPAFYGYENVHQRYAPKSVNSSSAEYFTPLSDDFPQNCLQSNSVSERPKTCTLLSNNSSLIECTSDEHTLADDEKAVISVDYGVEYVPVKKSKNGTLFDSVYPAPGTYFIQDKRAFFVPQPFDHKGRSIEPIVFEDVLLPLPASTVRNVISTAFPRNWKGCRDKCGNMYYYNKETRRTQWNLPEVEMECSECSARTQPESVVISSADSTSTPKDELEVHKEVTPAEVNGESENALNAVNNVDCSGTPIDSLPGTQVFEADPRKRRYISNAVANILSAAACNTGADSNVLFSVNNRNSFPTESKTERRIKEKFKAEMSEHIKHCLNPYRRIDCRVGRILNNDDFKYLARKLTHFVMVKELKHCKTIEELSCNDTVKHKAKDYVRKYMAKQGPVFKIDALEDKDEKNMSPKDGVTSDFALEQSIDDM